MADVRPFPALHYNLDVVNSLQSVTAPPYDVIDDEARQKLLQHSPFNVVEIDLPKASGEGSDPYQHAADTLEEWILSGVLTQDRDPTIWALTQEYEAPDGTTHTRNGILARVRVTDYGPGQIRPHERTQPGPKQDRLDLTRATRYNLSPIFSLTSKDAWPQVAAETEADPWAEVTDDEGTTHRLWPVKDPVVHAAVSEVLADAELLIADGHHRYETARTYMAEVPGEGAQCFTLMALTGLDDPGLTVFPTHRLLSGLAANADIQDHLTNGIAEAFDVEATDLDGLDPAGMEGIGCFGFFDQTAGRYLKLRLKDPLSLDGLMEAAPRPTGTWTRRSSKRSCFRTSSDSPRRTSKRSAASDTRRASTVPSNRLPAAPIRPLSSCGRPRSNRSGRWPRPARRCRPSRPTSTRSCFREWPSTR